MKRLKPMLATLTTKLPTEDYWLFEPKYDGYRCMLYCDEDGMQLWSRRGKSFNSSFPSLYTALSAITIDSSLLPVLLDGEMCVLQSPLKASFGHLHNRSQRHHHITYVGFDCLCLSGHSLVTTPLLERKSKLSFLYDTIKDEQQTISVAPVYRDGTQLFRAIEQEQGEGLIAKVAHSFYYPGQRTTDWLKYKNPQYGCFFIIAYDKTNGYFHGGVVHNHEVMDVGPFSHGLSSEEREALIAVIRNNKQKEDARYIYVRPSLVVELQYLELYKGKTRHPRFVSFRLDVKWEDCTWERINKNMSYE
ncbi:RNA ligase family protein [Fictibacillus macauensis]|uniref:ATP-dependent DNA ligase n=1 Tax=Fictibacillus macauensis TaxID=245160 RepID=UPI00138A0830|nr:RNA ligase family protein [Fictibacillus macauensis]